ncbi:MAG: transcription-repair coupling factor [Chitinophagales bacterium]|nr:transcription-repair coupling factor [Chitinophagales bacterium]
MNIIDILTNIDKDSRTTQIHQQLQSKKAHVFCSGIKGSFQAFLATALHRKSNQTHLFILNDVDEALYFQNDLQSILELKDILLLPSSYKKLGKFDELNNNNILLRAQTLNALLQQRKDGNLIISYPEAIIEKLVHKKKLQENTLFLKLGEKIDIDFILDLLLTYGFERTDFVYEPGEFSIRGGIIDIFSFGNDNPYRIELFDDEVESLRTFDAATQLSLKKINELTIIPNIQKQFIEEQSATIFDFLPKDTVIWFNDYQLLQEQTQKQYYKAVESWNNIHQNKKHQEHNFYNKTIDKLFITDEDFINQFLQYNTIEIYTKQQYTNKNDSLTITYHQEDQPIFNRNFDSIIQHLLQNNQEQINNFIFAENPRQIERFYHIFEDKQAAVKFFPIYQSISSGFIDKSLNLACYTDHQIFERYHKYKSKNAFTRSKSVTISMLKDLNPGDFVTHIDHGVGVFSGLEKMNINGQEQEMVRLKYKDNDLLYVNINSLHKITKYAGKEGQVPTVHKLGSNVWQNLKQKTKKKVKDIAKELIALYAKRKVQEGFMFEKDNYLQDELEASFIYEDTPDQYKATQEVKADMELPHPMDRLICGDVGFGKTEVAIRAAFKAVCNNKQVAVLVPTTILAWQHYKTFSSRLADFPVTVDYINRFKSAKEKTETLKKLVDGKIDILIGTHAILNKKIKFKNIGLLIIDEEQKFGVSAKEKIRSFAPNIDTLTLTATPIPRTLKFSLMGARDLSNIMTPPPNRQPVETEVQVFNVEAIKEAIEFEVFRGGQVFFVHNRIKDLHELEIMLKKLLPEISIQAAHGQMEGHQLEKIMLDFMQGNFDVLLSTNIVESGLDIPNANTIIINNAHHFGLSDLHQLRGRVGRGNKKAFCYLLAPPKSTLTKEARRRLQTLEEFADLGAGFQIALRDMDIRGAGNLLGGEQSGFIADIGFEMYHKILDEAIQELKHTDFKDLFKDQIAKQESFVYDCTIDTDFELLIPSEYVQNTDERLRLYTELDNIENEKQLAKFEQKLIDRFGKIPKQVSELFDGLRLRWLAKKIGFERISLKKNKMSCYFIENPNSAFYESNDFPKIMQYIQQGKNKCMLKQSGDKLILIYENIKTMHQAEHLLKDIVEHIKLDGL